MFGEREPTAAMGRKNLVSGKDGEAGARSPAPSPGGLKLVQNHDIVNIIMAGLLPRKFDIFSHHQEHGH